MARIFGRREEPVKEPLPVPTPPLAPLAPVREERHPPKVVEEVQEPSSIREVEINLGLLNEKLNVVINLLVKIDNTLSDAVEDKK
jgi:hypothetical protein